MVDLPNFVSYLNGTQTFEWYVAKCASKNKHQK